MEEWIKVTTHQQYSISSKGRVRNDKTGRLLNTPIDNSGYPRVNLTQNGTNRVVRVHRLVMESFVGLDEMRKQVNHINGIKFDNNKNNLEWVSPKENIEHAIRHGLVGPHRGGIPKKLKDREVWLIRRLLKPNQIQISKIAKMFRVSRVVIYNIRNGICYRGIGEHKK